MRTMRIWQLAAVSAMLGLGCGAGLDETQTTEDNGNIDPQIASTRAFSNQHRGVMPLREPALAAPTTATAAKLQYYGGHVISSVKVVVVFWGSKVNTTVTVGIGGFYSAVTNGAYWSWLSEYNTNITPVGGGTGTNQVIGAGSLVGTYTITPSTTATTLDDTVIQSELKKQIAAGKLPPTDSNTYYPVFFPPGVKITQGGTSSCVSGGFCAYHGTVAGSPEIYYGVHPDMGPGSGCDTGCGSSTLFNNMTSVASHELVEATTDAEVGLASANAPPLAWYDTTNGEIGDICNAEQGTISGYTVQKEWSNKAGACIVTAGACTPACTDKTCGPDGCGGVCGTCPTGETCNAGGTCGTTCVPNCTGKQCGSDGCGGSCGSCASGQTCSAAGQCTGGGGGGSCTHSECKTGKKLVKSCDPCVTQICTVDSYCCKYTWDSVCVGEAASVCGETC